MVQTIEKWRRYELTIEDVHVEENPFRDVTFTATFEHNNPFIPLYIFAMCACEWWLLAVTSLTRHLSWYSKSKPPPTAVIMADDPNDRDGEQQRDRVDPLIQLLMQAKTKARPEPIKTSASRSLQHQEKNASTSRPKSFLPEREPNAAHYYDDDDEDDNDEDDDEDDEIVFVSPKRRASTASLPTRPNPSHGKMHQFYERRSRQVCFPHKACPLLQQEMLSTSQDMAKGVHKQTDDMRKSFDDRAKMLKTLENFRTQLVDSIKHALDQSHGKRN